MTRSKFPRMESVPQLTPREYLEWERTQEGKNEYWDGRVYAMSGASFSHNRLVARLIASLDGQLAGGGCDVYASDLKIANSSGTRFFYPDVTVICGPPETLEEERDVAVNPTVLIEVLSQSTEAYDRGPKFLAYQALSTLQDYLLVSQGSAQVEHYQRHPEGSWLYTKHEGLDACIELPSVGARLRLRDLYRKDHI